MAEADRQLDQGAPGLARLAQDGPGVAAGRADDVVGSGKMVVGHGQKGYVESNICIARQGWVASV
jgi:hypothetical protein